MREPNNFCLYVYEATFSYFYGKLSSRHLNLDAGRWVSSSKSQTWHSIAFVPWNIAFCRTRNIFKALGLSDFTRVNIQVLGSEQTYGSHANKNLVSFFSMSKKWKKNVSRSSSTCYFPDAWNTVPILTKFRTPEKLSCGLQLNTVTKRRWNYLEEK